MLCLNCGRRSSDRKSFCEHCGAIASDEPPSVVPPRASQTVARSRTSVASRPSPSRQTVRRTGAGTAKSGSNPIGTLIFWGLVAYTAYWFVSDGRDFRSIVEDFLQQPRQESPVRQPAPVAPRTPSPAATQPAPASTPNPPAAPVERRTEPSATRPPAAAPPPSGAPERGSVPPLQPAGAAASDPGIEGLSPAQVIQKLGRPASVVSLNGVTGWSYRDGALIVYFVKDRATLKPPR